MNNANKRANKAKNPVEMLEAKVVVVVLVPVVLNVSTKTSVAIPLTGSIF